MWGELNEEDWWVLRRLTVRLGLTLDGFALTLTMAGTKPINCPTEIWSNLWRPDRFYVRLFLLLSSSFLFSTAQIYKRNKKQKNRGLLKFLSLTNRMKCEALNLHYFVTHSVWKFKVLSWNDTWGFWSILSVLRGNVLKQQGREHFQAGEQSENQPLFDLADMLGLRGVQRFHFSFI